MPLPPDDAPRPGRIILPGSEPEAPRREPLVTPSGAPAGAAAEATPRIVLPPGTTRETDDDVPEHPRLRALSILPVRDGQQELLLITDPLGLLTEPVALRLESLALLQLLDGRTSLTDLSAAMVRGSGDIRAGSWVREFVGQLDKMLLLESPRFEQAYDELKRQYHALEVHQSMFAGHSYPADPDEAARFVDAHFAAADASRRESGGAAPAADATPRLVLAPHLDPRRAGATLALALSEIGTERATPLRVVVFGVGHMLWESWVALTRKHFETPWGRVTCDTRFVDALAARLGDEAYRGEIAHRDEHSIEFAAVYLHRRFGARPLTLVPILAGGYHALLEVERTPGEVPELAALVEAVRATEREQGGDTVYLAAVDLSHVGPRFGDPAPDERVKDETGALDHAALEAARHGDADGWFHAIAAGQDATRICGWGATDLALRCASPVSEGRLLRYEQSGEEDGTFVSVAAMAWA
jgi:MEMO1 family protein